MTPAAHQALFDALRAIDPAVIGVHIPDEADASTWTFTRDVVRVNPKKPKTWTPAPPLTIEELVTLRAAVADVLNPPILDLGPTPLETELADIHKTLEALKAQAFATPGPPIPVPSDPPKEPPA